MTDDLSDSRFDFTPPDTFRLDDALGCGAHSTAVELAILSGDWGEVTRLADASEEAA